MNKESAIKYVSFGLERIKISKLSCAKHIFLNFIILLISNILFIKSYIIIITFIIIIITSVYAYILFKNLSLINMYILNFILYAGTVISLNIFNFSLQKFEGSFNILDLLISILIQIIMVIISVHIIKSVAVKIENKKPTKIEKFSYAAGTCATIGSIISKIYLSDASQELWSLILNILVTIISIGLILIIVGFLYKAYLIKKYNISK